MNQQNYREALRFYEEALVLDSCYVPAINNSGIVQFEQQHYSQAIQWFSRALQCDPENYDAILNRSNSFYEFGEVYRAEDDLMYLRRQHPDSATIYFRLGLVHARMKNFREAVADFDEALSRDPGFVEAMINRGTAFYYLDELGKAETDLRKGLELDPKQALAYNTLAMVETKRGNLAEALNLVNNALGFEPGDAYLLNNLGYILMLSGDLEAGRENIDKSITRDPSNAWAYRNKGRYYFLKGQYQDALRLYDRALREGDFIELIHTFRGDALEALGSHKQACEAWRKGVEEGEMAAATRLEENACS